MTPAMIINRRGRMREDGDMKEYEQTSFSTLGIGIRADFMDACVFGKAHEK